MRAWLNYSLLLLGSLLLLVLIVIVLLFSWPRPQFDLAPARDFGWQLPTLEQASYHFQVRADGKLDIELQHPLLQGITPSMVAWWYRQLPIGRVTWNGQEYSYYHLFHPSEHGVIKVLEPSPNGDPGMAEGSLVYRQERFGPFYSKGQGRVLRFSDAGMLVAPEMAGLQFGRIEHRFESVEGGTRYSVHSVLGSDLPVLGALINYYIRYRRFPAPVLQQWLRHQVEEVGTLRYFLPQLYRDRSAGQ